MVTAPYRTAQQLESRPVLRLALTRHVAEPDARTSAAWRASVGAATQSPAESAAVRWQAEAELAAARQQATEVLAAAEAEAERVIAAAVREAAGLLAEARRAVSLSTTGEQEPELTPPPLALVLAAPAPLEVESPVPALPVLPSTALAWVDLTVGPGPAVPVACSSVLPAAQGRRRFLGRAGA